MAIFGDDFDITFIREQYNEYIDEHIKCVKKGYEWIKEYLPNLIMDGRYATDIYNNVMSHDQSKFDEIEYDAYANYFYGKKTDDVVREFDFAWNHHQKCNPHHWQYWVLINDTDGIKCLDMPYQYLFEMFLDHWAFSWKKGDLKEISNWYDTNKDKIYLSEHTREIYEKLLKIVLTKVDELSKSDEVKLF